MPSLLTLPAELRNQIYNVVFEPEVLTMKRRISQGNANAMALSHVNRQLYHETSLLPYQRHTFLLLCLEQLVDFLASRSEAQRRAIRSLSLGTWHGARYKHSSDDEIVVEDLAFLGGLKGLEKVDIVLHGVHKPASVATRLPDLAKIIRKWQPNVSIVAKCPRKGWKLELKVDAQIYSFRLQALALAGV
jgi:hypothetical protein